MRSTTRALALPLLIAAVGCGEVPATEVSTHAVTPYTSPYAYPGACPPSRTGHFLCGKTEGTLTGQLAEACVDTDWVGYRVGTGTSCLKTGTSSYGTWEISKLFPAGPPNRRAQLDRFCKYHWKPARGYSGPPVTSILPNSGLMRLERDCDAVAPQLVPGLSAASFEASYAQLVDRPKFSPGASLSSAAQVRVAVVDDSKDENTGLPSAGTYGHGFLMGAVARENSCLHINGIATDCAAEIVSYAGLPGGVGGASRGRPSDVAAAMEAAVREWVEGGKRSKLIINLSLGWDGVYSGHYGPNIRTTVLSAWEVAQWATCEGAVIVAAAGNRGQVGSSAEAMFPAGWEQWEPRVCPGAPGAYAPLVHAAGGVDARDNAIMVERARAAPRLLLPAALVTASSPDSGGQRIQGRLASGTSLAAAGVSGAAALVWAMAPSLDGDEVMQVLYDTGIHFPKLPGVAYAPGQNQTRVDICEAVSAVCAGSSCPQVCAPRPYQSDGRPGYAALLELERPGTTTRPPDVAPITFYPSVPAQDDIYISPNAGPQPGGDACPLCGLTANFLVGQISLPADADLVEVFMRTEPCGEGCAPDIGGFKVDLPSAVDPFKVDVSAFVDTQTLDKAMLEITTETDGELVVRSAELFIEN